MQLLLNSNNSKIRTARFNKETGDITFFDAEGAVIEGVGMERTIFEERGQKTKVVERAFINSTTLKGVFELTKFDGIFVIDTSTKKELISNLSISCYINFSVKKIKGKYIPQYDNRCHFHEFMNIYSGDIYAERFAIANLISSLPSDKKFLIYTDTVLGAHTALNSGLLSLWGSFKVPSNITLAYAKDQGESFLNKLLKFCDKAGTKHRKNIDLSYYKTNCFQRSSLDPNVKMRYFWKGLEIEHESIDTYDFSESTKITLYARKKNQGK